MSKILIDTSFAYALYDTKDIYHQAALQWVDVNPTAQLLLPNVALVEATYLIRKNSNDNMLRVVVFLKNFIPKSFQLEAVHAEDVERASEIMLQYVDAKLDFVDCIISAQAERYIINLSFG